MTHPLEDRSNETNVNRRAVLATVGAGFGALSGCTATLSPGSTKQANSFPTLAVSEVSDLSAIDLELSVDVTQQFSADHWAELRIALTNYADTDREWAFDRIQPFNSVIGTRYGDDRSNRMLLIPYAALDEDDPTETYRDYPAGDRSGPLTPYVPRSTVPEEVYLIPEEPVNGCWQSTLSVELRETRATLRLDAGETISEDYIVLAHPENGEHCLQEGSYAFASGGGHGSLAPFHPETAEYPEERNARIILKVLE